jgi:threonine dehydrogenase-like Zn-dependent dehydrogenase
MKAIAVFPKEHAVRLIDAPEPSIESPTQVKLRMLDVGICGTEALLVGEATGIKNALRIAA